MEKTNKAKYKTKYPFFEKLVPSSNLKLSLVEILLYKAIKRKKATTEKNKTVLKLKRFFIRNCGRIIIANGRMAEKCSKVLIAPTYSFILTLVQEV